MLKKKTLDDKLKVARWQRKENNFMRGIKVAGGITLLGFLASLYFCDGIKEKVREEAKEMKYNVERKIEKAEEKGEKYIKEISDLVDY